MKDIYGSRITTRKRSNICSFFVNFLFFSSTNHGDRGGNDVKIKYRERTSENSVATPRLLHTFGHKSI